MLLPAVLLLIATLAGAEPVVPAGVAPGDVAVSGFSGTRVSTDILPPGVDLLDKTFIDVDGASLRIYDLSALGRSPAGQVVSPPVKFTARAKDIGQVFPLVFDNGTETRTPNLYAGATSAYGIQIVSTQLDDDGTPVRVRNGAPGVRFMDGQFGSLPGAGPGTIYKIDGKTGEATVFADVSSKDVGNSGPGIGGLAIDPASHMLYVSDLDTGLIHRFALDQNAGDLGQFDHGVNGRPTRGLSAVPDDGKRMDVTKPTFKPDSIATYGFTQPERRVRALAVHTGRLYYAVDDGPEIWSVALNPDGSLNGEDVRSELLVKSDRPLPITSIVFDGQGRMTVAQRSMLKSPYDYGAFVEPGGAQVLRFAMKHPDDGATSGIWAPEPQSYAVGFGEGNKSAAGGAALQYAYRPDGTLDLNACYGTLAATADGLTPEGSGHGLQLNDAALVLPATDPLQQSAFVEYDSSQNKADLLGHVGAAAVFHACAGEGAPPIAGGPGYPPIGGGYPPVGGGGAFPPVGGGGAFPPVEGGPPGFPPIGGEPPPLGGPPPGPPGIELHKSAVSENCNETKNCTYKLTIENTTDQAINGPFVIEDTLEAGAAALNSAKITVGPDPPWVCTAAPPKFTCMHPGPIPANTTSITTISFLPGPIGNAKEVKNCAMLAGGAGQGGPQGGTPVPSVEPACATIPVKEEPQLTIAKKATVASCTNNGGCAFQVDIANTGRDAILGPFTVNETVTVNDVFFPSMSLEAAPPAPWTCTAVAATFSCTHPGPLAAGATATLPLSFKIASVQDKPTKIKNCAAVQGAAEQCAEIPVVEPPQPPPPPPPTKANLAINATDHGEPTCALTGPCTFVGSITNDAGAAPYNGKYILSVTFRAGREAPSPDLTPGYVKYELPVGSAGWTCAPPADEERSLIRCEHPQQLGPAGGPFGNAMPLFLDLTPGTEWAKNNLLIACFQLGNDPAGNDTFDPQKPKDSCATKRLDPFAVQIKKSGGESCSPGSECRFDLEIFNPGPILHDDPVTVTDNLIGLASAPIVSIVPAAGAKPFPCSPAPTQIPFSCSGHMRLEVNERQRYTITVKLPADAPVSGAFKNCATIASLAGTKSDEDCHEVKLAPACTGGMELNADGRCACPAGQKWDGRACAVGKEVCPPSKPVGTPPNCCAQGFEYRDSACRCPVGTQLAKSGACIPLKCPPNRPIGTPPNCCPKGMTYKEGACRCPEGMQLSRRGVCIAVQRIPDKCPVERPVGAPPNCCPKSMTYKDGACRCPVGTQFTNGVCIAIPEVCPANRPVGTPPNCCPQNSEYANGTCVCRAGTVGVPPYCAKQKEQKPQSTCPTGTIGTPPNCKCPEGTQWSRRHQTCQPVEKTPSQPEPKMCLPYGQACRNSGECCNNVPCNGGLCRYD